MVSKQQDISSEISTCECSAVNCFGFAEKLLRYTEQEEVFSHWTLKNIHSKKKKALSLLLFTSLLEIGEGKTKHANAHGTNLETKRLEKLVSIPDIGEHIFVSSTSSCLLNTLVLRIMSFKTIKEKPKKERTEGRTLSLFSDPHASLLNSQEKHHLIVLVLDPQKNFRPSSSSSSLLQFASEKEDKKSCICRNCKQRRERSSHTTGASGPVRRVRTRRRTCISASPPPTKPG